MKIRITKQELQKGRSRDSWACPVALAMNKICDEIFGQGVVMANVGTRSISISHRREMVTLRLPLPAEMSAWIRRYDDKPEGATPAVLELPLLS